MLLRQKSAFHGFAYEFLADGQSLVLGEFRYAWLSQAKNPRLRFHAPADAALGDIHLNLLGESWRVRYLYLRRDSAHDLRYTLETAEENIHAQIDVLAGPRGVRQPKVVMTLPVHAELGTSKAWLRRKFVLTSRDTGRNLGVIQEPALFSTRRELQIDIPEMAPAVAAFLGMVALIVRN